MSLLWVPYMSDTKDGETVVQEHLSPDTFPVYTGNQSTSQIGGLQEDWEIYTWCWAHANDSTCEKLLGLFSAFSLLVCTFIEYL